MRLLSRRFLTVLTSVVVASLAIAPLAIQADAATTGPTTVTFTITAGALNISTPATVNLGAGFAGANTTGQLGAVTVTDLRGALIATWTATVSSSTFTTGGATAPETIPLTAISYWSGASTSVTGIGVATPGELLAAAATTLTAPKTAFTLTAGVGNNTVVWNPTLVIAVPAAAVAGTYTGIVTHSVA